MNKALLYISMVLFCPARLAAQDTDTLSKATILNDPVLIMEYSAVEQSFPAMMLLSPYMTNTVIGAGIDHRQESKALIHEEGKGDTGGVFDAESFIRLGRNSSARGSAQYRRALKRDVYMNETTDYLLLRPYVLVDTLSGDLQHESYQFSGGWSHLENGLLIDLGGEYRAAHEYRNVDPRPRNISSDLKASASVGAVGNRVTILGTIGYRRYRQSQDVVFMSQSGANTALFHATGLGHDYYRFRSTGIFAATRYSGDGFNAGLLVKDFRSNLCAGIRYDYLSTTRFLANQNDAPLTMLHTGTADAFMTYRPSKSFALKMDVIYESRRGFENVIDCAASGIYRNLLSLEMYSSQRIWATMSSVFRYGKFHFAPEVTYYRALESYAYPAAQSKMSVAFADMDLGYTYCRDGWFFAPSLKGGLGSGYALCELKGYVQKEVGDNLAVFGKGRIGLLSYGGGEHACTLTFTIGITY